MGVCVPAEVVCRLDEGACAKVLCGENPHAARTKLSPG
jgi:hypothetical protein